MTIEQFGNEPPIETAVAEQAQQTAVAEQAQQTAVAEQAQQTESQKLSVMKFGSSVLRDSESVDLVVQSIYAKVREGHRVLAVVSAIGDTTDRLIKDLARFDVSDSNAAAFAAYLATGELQSAAFLQLALDNSGVPSTVCDAREFFTVEGERRDAKPGHVDVETLETEFEHFSVIVIPGFIGRHTDGGTGLLGRGGSDLSAVYLAQQLNADECVLVKDVDGVYVDDPSVTEHRFDTVTYDDARRVSEVLVQPKAVDQLEKTNRIATVTDLFSRTSTTIGTPHSALGQPDARRLTRAILVGCGTVGEEVYRRLSLADVPYEITGVCVRDIQKARAVSIPSDKLTDDLEELFALPHDVVIELTSDSVVARTVVGRCVDAGVPVVTANKILASELATTRRNVWYSAAAGGAVPLIETVELAKQHGRIQSLRGVLNGTCNFVLNTLRDGGSLRDAVDIAIARGFAEADPTRDLDGTDTADKLRILARHAFGLYPIDIEQSGIDDDSLSDGSVWRLIASIDSAGRASVHPTVVQPSDPLYDLLSEENALHITFESGECWTVKGKGAGGAPTASAVIADLLDVRETLDLSDRPAVNASGERIPFHIEGPKEGPLVVCLGGISAGGRASSWWPNVVGDGCGIDTTTFRVVSFDWSGLDTGGFGVAEQSHAILEHLDQIEGSVHAIVGASFGGLVAQHLLTLRPDITERVVVLAAAHRPHPFASGLRHIQRSILKRGDAEDVALARSLAMLTYRSAEEFSERFEAPREVEIYLDHAGQKILGRFTAQSYVGLSQAIDDFSSTPEEHSQHLTLVGFESDVLVPTDVLREFAERWGGAVNLHTIKTRFGHDGFLKETQHVSRVLTCALGE